MLAKLLGAVLISLDTYIIELEIEHRNGFPGFDIVGLPDTTVKEAKERVMQSIRHSGFDIQFRRILCNLAPADIKKTGSFLDLPIAVGILMSSGIIEKQNIQNTIIVGELGFEGQVRAISGSLSIVLHAKQNSIKNIILPYQNLKEVSVIPDINIFGVQTLKEVVEVLDNKHKPNPHQVPKFNDHNSFNIDFSEVKGQSFAKRALEISAAGFHNILMMGSPGVGKSMLAKRLPTIMPPLTLEECIEITQIYSISPFKNTFNHQLITQRPFRSPHHSSSEASIIGGGTIPKPGEISLAHQGILFLDEFPEFKKNIFESLREPLEDKIITISRTEKTQQFPANFLMVAAMNPCLCGYLLHPQKDCTCSTQSVHKYYNKISGPILDRIDIQIQMAETKYSDIQNQEESSNIIQQRVIQAVEIQKKRFNKSKFNSQMSMEEIQLYCLLDSNSENLLKASMEKFSLSMRSYTKILTIARTIADLELSSNIETHHLLEALQYRNVDKVLRKI